MITQYFALRSAAEVTADMEHRHELGKVNKEHAKRRAAIRAAEELKALKTLQENNEINNLHFTSAGDSVVVEEIAVNVVYNDEQPVNISKRKYMKRSDSWRTVAQYQLEHCNMIDTIRRFQEIIGGVKVSSKKKTVLRWVDEVKLERSNKVIKKPRYGRSAPVYGNALDIKLRDKVMNRLKDGVPTDNFMLQRLLYELMTLLGYGSFIERWHSGEFTFGDSWAKRF